MNRMDPVDWRIEWDNVSRNYLAATRNEMGKKVTTDKS